MHSLTQQKSNDIEDDLARTGTGQPIMGGGYILQKLFLTLEREKQQEDVNILIREKKPSR